MSVKKRILNERLAAIVASIRHGEMLFIADAGSGTSEKALYPLCPSVEYLNLEAVTGSPSFQDIVSVIVDVGDFEGAIVTDLMPNQNPKDFQFITGLLGEKNIHQMPYIPDYYQMRDRCKAVIQTGDYGAHAQAILIAGYPTANIPMEWLKEGLKK
jgi:D-ribose pyranase